MTIPSYDVGKKRSLLQPLQHSVVIHVIITCVLYFATVTYFHLQQAELIWKADVTSLIVVP